MKVSPVRERVNTALMPFFVADDLSVLEREGIALELDAGSSRTRGLNT